MDYSPKITVESKVLPGVSFTLHRMTVARRAQIHAAIAGIRAQIRDLQRERKPLEDEYRKVLEAAQAAAKAEVDKLVSEGMTREEAEARVPLDVQFPEDKAAALSDSLVVQRRLERDGIGGAYARALLVSVGCLTIDGETPTVGRVLEEGPIELVDEVAAAAQKVAELSPGDRGNSLWPGTSAPAEAGPQTDTAATSAASAPESA